MREGPNKHIALALLFLGLLALLLGTAVWRTPLSSAIDTNMFALLPPSADMPAVVKDATDKVRQNFERRQTFVVRHEDRTKARAAAKALVQTLWASGHYAVVGMPTESAGPQAIINFYAPFGPGLLDQETRDLLLAKQPERLVERAIQDLYNPLSTAGHTNIETDPFLLLPRFMAGLASQASSNLMMDDGFLTFVDGKLYHIVVPTQLSSSPFLISYQQTIERLTDGARETMTEEYPEAELIIDGVIEYVLRGARVARGEIKMVGLGSLFGVIGLSLLTFLTARPVLGISLTIGSGILAGFFACLLVFGNVHILTLISGGTLIGITIDYALHFLAHHYGEANSRTVWQSLNSIRKALLLGCLTSVISFAGLALSGFPGLQQIAVFSMAGMTAALGSVFALYPLLFKPSAGVSLSAAALTFANRWKGLWAHSTVRKTALGLFAIFGLFAASQLTELEVRDDVRLLSFRQDSLPATADSLAKRTGGQTAGQFFLVTGPNAETVLRREEALAPLLIAAHRNGRLTSHVMLSQFVPSRFRQSQNRALKQQLLEGDTSPLNQLTQAVGLSPETSAAYAAALRAPDAIFLQPTAFLKEPFAREASGLWLGDQDGVFSSIVALKGVSELPALRDLSANREGVEFIDYVGVMSATLGKYRERATVLLMIAYVLVLAIIFRCYGWIVFRGTLLVLFGTAITIAGTLVLIGEAVNLFHVIGGMLVLGIGVDYIIFLSSPAGNRPTTMLAIMLSALTTIMAFGLLSFSSLGALHAFGLTVLIGIPSVFLLASVVIAQRMPVTESRGEK